MEESIWIHTDNNVDKDNPAHIDYHISLNKPIHHHCNAPRYLPSTLKDDENCIPDKELMHLQQKHSEKSHAQSLVKQHLNHNVI